MTNTKSASELDLGADLATTRSTRRLAGGGTWVLGTLHGHRFEALVFPEHAEDRTWEVDDSRISKLWIRRLADRKPVYGWDREPDLPAADDVVGQIVEFLCAGLADHVYPEGQNA